MKRDRCLWNNLVRPGERNFQSHVAPLSSNSRSKHIELAFRSSSHSSAIIVGEKDLAVCISYEDFSKASRISSDNVSDVSTSVYLIFVRISLSLTNRSKLTVHKFSTDRN